MFRKKSNIIMFAQGIPGCMPWGLIMVYLNDYLHVNSGAPTVLAATTIVTIFNVGSLFGQAFGGWYGQRLYNRKRRYVAFLMGLTTIAGIFPLLVLINIPFSYGAMSPTAFVGGFLASITGPNVRAVLQNCNLPEARGTVFAFFALTDDVGKALGPYLISLFVGAFGRRAAFDVAALTWGICGALLLSLACTLERDEDDVIEHVKVARRAAVASIEMGALAATK